MERIRWLFASLMIASAMMTVGAGAVAAQTGTPITVPTATANGCDKVPAYAEMRQKIMDELIANIGMVFPGVATPITEHGDQLAVAMMIMTPEQLGRLAQLYDDTSKKIGELAVPEIAFFYNQQVEELYRVSALAFAEAKASDLATAGQRFGAQLGALGAAIGEYGASATAVCPAFAEVVQVDQTRVGM